MKLHEDEEAFAEDNSCLQNISESLLLKGIVTLGLPIGRSAA